jgi:uncharacterized protein
MQSDRPVPLRAGELTPSVRSVVVVEYQMRVTASGISRVATLMDNATARAIWSALPLEARANRWGDEIYFTVPVELPEDHAQEAVDVGALAYWPPGRAVCIFWGPTPASEGSEPRAASPVNVFGQIIGDFAALGSIRSGAIVRLERA